MWTLTERTSWRVSWRVVWAWQAPHCFDFVGSALTAAYIDHSKPLTHPSFLPFAAENMANLTTSPPPLNIPNFLGGCIMENCLALMCDLTLLAWDNETDESQIIRCHHYPSICICIKLSEGSRFYQIFGVYRLVSLTMYTSSMNLENQLKKGSGDGSYHLPPVSNLLPHYHGVWSCRGFGKNWLVSYNLYYGLPRSHARCSKGVWA